MRKKKKNKLSTAVASVPKQYAVSITYNYLLKAPTKEEAIGMAMDRLLGRKFGQVYFDGMVTKAELTDRVQPSFYEHPKIMENKCVVHGVSNCELCSFDDFQKFEVKGDEKYGVRIDRDRTDTKEQDYIHFDPTD